jgi:hypothetical protein
MLWELLVVCRSIVMLFLAPLCRNSSFYIFFLSFHISYNALHRPIMVRREFICLSSRLKIINITIFDCPWPINLPLEHIKTTANLSFIGLVDLCQFLGTISTFLLFWVRPPPAWKEINRVFEWLRKTKRFEVFQQCLPTLQRPSHFIMYCNSDFFLCFVNPTLFFYFIILCFFGWRFLFFAFPWMDSM